MEKKIDEELTKVVYDLWNKSKGSMKHQDGSEVISISFTVFATALCDIVNYYHSPEKIEKFAKIATDALYKYMKG